jgi:hypothetical protein
MGTASDLDRLLKALDRADTAVRADLRLPANLTYASVMSVVAIPEYSCRDCGAAREDITSRDLTEPQTSPADRRDESGIVASSAKPCPSCGSCRVKVLVSPYTGLERGSQGL